MDILPIQADDKHSVAVFLHKNLFHKISVEQWINGLFPPWSEDFPIHGYMIVDNNNIVGVLIVIYSKMLIDGKEAVFGNLSSWCVLEEYRKGLSSIMLMRKSISDKNVNYTATTPNDISQNILKTCGFEMIDNSIYLIPSLPWFYSKKTIITDPDMLVAKLDDATARIYNDHKYIKWLNHLVISDGHDFCYVIYRDWKMRHSNSLKNSRILYLSNSHVFHNKLLALRGFFLARGYPATTVNKRFLQYKPFFSFERQRSKQVSFRGVSLSSDAFTNAYTQVMTFEAYY
jgi:hypothetical protein